MTSPSKWYCKVFVDAPITAEDLARQLGGRLGIPRPWNTVRTDNLELEVHENESFVKPRRREHLNDFVLYQLFIDIELVPSAFRESYIREVAELLTWLWNQGFRAVAACDFEDELPKHELGSFGSSGGGASIGRDK